MKKNLSEMTLRELWELFPIFLTKHNPEWRLWYEEERQALQKLLPMDDVVRISHIGSTAVDGIWAKPIVDILIEVRKGRVFKPVSDAIQKAGYRFMSSEEERVSFNKGYTPDGFAEKTFHLHLRRQNDNDELYFRDYLKENPRVSKEYEKLKLGLWPVYEHNRDGYTESKTNFVKRYTAQAKALYGDKYHEV